MSILQTLTRDQVVAIYGCSHGDLGRLLRENRAPLPVRVDGAIFWYLDEVEKAKDRVKKILEFRKRH